MSDYITEDALVLIFKRLPEKSLLRFRSVCKGWKEFIDSPFFIKEHLSVQRPLFLFQNKRSPLQDCFVLDPDTLPLTNPLDSPIEDKKLLFCGTHHGLVLLYEDSKNLKILCKLLIWNPSIRKSLTILIPDLKVCRFAYKKGLNLFGFWIDPSTKECKIVVLMLLEKEENVAADADRGTVRMDGMLYSSTRNWMYIESPKEAIRTVELCPPVMIGEVAHWIGWRLEVFGRVILTFDFSLEKFDTIHMPNHLQCCPGQYTLCHWKGNLSFVARDTRYYELYNMYMRREGAWLKMFSFKTYPDDIVKVQSILGGKERMAALVGSSGQMMVLYDDSGSIVPFNDCHLVYGFVKTLLSP